jgi:hypothetical protein
MFGQYAKSGSWPCVPSRLVVEQAAGSNLCELPGSPAGDLLPVSWTVLCWKIPGKEGRRDTAEGDDGANA